MEQISVDILITTWQRTLALYTCIHGFVNLICQETGKIAIDICSVNYWKPTVLEILVLLYNFICKACKTKATIKILFVNCCILVNETLKQIGG